MDVEQGFSIKFLEKIFFNNYKLNTKIKMTVSREVQEKGKRRKGF